MISIVIAMYNSEKYIENCVTSILNNRYTDFEIIIVDDGSTDNSLILCKKMEKDDSRIKVYYKENGGVSSARNLGIDMASGEYITFVDSDDTVTEEYLGLLNELIIQDDVEMGICGVYQNKRNIICADSKLVNEVWDREKVMEEIFTPNSIAGYLVNKIFKTSIIKEYHIYLNVNSYLCEDALFCLQYTMHIKHAIINNQPTYNYILREGSATNQKFNPKWISIIYTYEQIEHCIKDVENITLHNIIMIAKIEVYMRIFVRIIFSNKTKEYVDILEELWEQVYVAYKYIFRGVFSFKSIVKYILICLYKTTHLK